MDSMDKAMLSALLISVFIVVGYFYLPALVLR